MWADVYSNATGQLVGTLNTWMPGHLAGLSYGVGHATFTICPIYPFYDIIQPLHWNPSVGYVYYAYYYGGPPWLTEHGVMQGTGYWHTQSLPDPANGCARFGLV